jgi:hypothetical protein
MHRPSVWSVALVLAAGLLARAADEAASRHERILADIKHLASDELEGRGVGTTGLDRAAEYIRDQFERAGLKPPLADTGYFQPFQMPNGAKLGEPNELVLRGPDGRTIPLSLNKDFIPLASSGSGKLDAPVVFAGYSITAPEYGYDDYADVDVKGKVVLAIRREPRQSAEADPHAPFAGNMETQHSDLRRKAANAARRRAAAVLFVTEPHSLKSQPDELLKFGYAAELRVGKTPLVHMTRAAADAVLKSAVGKDLAQLEAAIDEDLKPQTTVLEGWRCSGEITVEQQHAEVRNVLGVLEGSGPLSEETIVIGGHYDHLGHGEAGSRAPGSREIHNGADDNASGTAGVIEVARRLAARREPLGRRVVFIAFTGEERGLHGSDYYVKHPAVPIEKTVAMINLDMIGRLSDEKLIVEGIGTAKEFTPLVESLSSERQFKLSPVQSGIGPSDHTSFCQLKVPVLFFWTGYHPDYHMPSDDWEKVSIEGLDRIAGLVEATVVSLAAAESRPTFVEVPSRMAAGPGQAGGERAYLGSIPAFGTEVDGVLLDGVAPGGPAQKAGLRGGDIIIEIGDKPVHNLEDMELALRSFKPGNLVRIAVRRGELKVTYPVTLGRRPQ